MVKRKKDEEQNPSGRLGEFGSAIMQIADEKGIAKDKVIEIVEAALAAAYKKDYGKRGQKIRAQFDSIVGDTKFFLVKEVVDETVREFVDEEDEEGKSEVVGTSAIDEEERLPRFNSERDIILKDAKKIKKDAKIGDIVEIELESQEDYGRVAAQTAKQVIIQRVREAEREAMFSEYKEKEGEVVSGTVQRIEGRNIYIELGKSTGVLFPSDQVKGESYRIGQRVKVYLVRVDSDPKGPGMVLSRTSAEMVRKLFELEVPEIFAGTVEIKSIAREAGARSKIAVVSKEEGIDPIGSCVGQKGTRVQAVIDELGGEKIDIVKWDENSEKFISSAISPAKVLSVEINEKENQAVVKVPHDQLSLAIGKQGQNVRLAAKLTGWKIDVVGESNNVQQEEISDENKPEIKEEDEQA